ncbi:MAG: hypothetical protein HC792_06080 [Acaryochloridaceae cyanobacterium CSU_5_19]|nr:hypothetical protein [Acaryochloridaceae cyanobacterium CSU_5_19]
MKSHHRFWFKFLTLKTGFSPSGQRVGGSTEGFTLVELLTATVMTAMVTTLVGMGIVWAFQSNQRTEAIAARRHDLSRAFDFISNEVRMAARINQSQTAIATNSASLATVISSSGLNLSSLGNYGTLVLYLEVPIVNPPTVCPAGGPNAGSPPPQPANYDRVIYDIRPSQQDWLPPNSIFRFGRVPTATGEINPCSDPISSDILVDAITSNSASTIACPAPGILMGATGFQACVTDSKVNLLLRSHISQIRNSPLE